MKELILNIGAVKAVKEDTTMVCFGLGSCIGLFVQDRVTGISGGAHILLPEHENSNMNDENAYNAVKAINTLLQQFEKLGSSLQTLRAKVVGGSNVMSVPNLVGKQNAKSVIDELVKRKVFIAACDIGGVYSRTARFNTINGELVVKTPETSQIKIYS